LSNVIQNEGIWIIRQATTPSKSNSSNKNNHNAGSSMRSTANNDASNLD
jgi:hypothetical protein